MHNMYGFDAFSRRGALWAADASSMHKSPLGEYASRKTPYPSRKTPYASRKTPYRGRKTPYAICKSQNSIRNMQVAKLHTQYASRKTPYPTRNAMCIFGSPTTIYSSNSLLEH